jgi:succinylglutamate desuccinylase
MLKTIKILFEIIFEFFYGYWESLKMVNEYCRIKSDSEIIDDFFDTPHKKQHFQVELDGLIKSNKTKRELNVDGRTITIELL